MTKSKEVVSAINYTQRTYDLLTEKGGVTSSQVAIRLGISTNTACGALQHLGSLRNAVKVEGSRPNRWIRGPIQYTPRFGMPSQKPPTFDELISFAGLIAEWWIPPHPVKRHYWPAT